MTHGETIKIISSDGVMMNVSSFMMDFFGNTFYHDLDCIITPITSSILNVIVDLLNLKKNVELEDEEYYQLLGLDTKGLKDVWEILNTVNIENITSSHDDKIPVPEISSISNLFLELQSFVKVASINQYEDNNSDVAKPLVKYEDTNLVASNCDAGKDIEFQDQAKDSIIDNNSKEIVGGLSCRRRR